MTLRGSLNGDLSGGHPDEKRALHWQLEGGLTASFFPPPMSVSLSPLPSPPPCCLCSGLDAAANSSGPEAEAEKEEKQPLAALGGGSWGSQPRPVDVRQWGWGIPMTLQLTSPSPGPAAAPVPAWLKTLCSTRGGGLGCTRDPSLPPCTGLSEGCTLAGEGEKPGAECWGCWREKAPLCPVASRSERSAWLSVCLLPHSVPLEQAVTSSSREKTALPVSYPNPREGEPRP